MLRHPCTRAAISAKGTLGSWFAYSKEHFVDLSSAQQQEPDDAFSTFDVV
jgi:hypothetical protein